MSDHDKAVAAVMKAMKEWDFLPAQATTIVAALEAAGAFTCPHIVTDETEGNSSAGASC